MAAHAGKRPIVMPRLQRYGEAVDDHQLGFARRLAEAGVLELAHDGEELRRLIADRADRRCATVQASDLGSDLRSYLVETLGPPPCTLVASPRR